jgi:hypothetical protein
VAKHGHPFAGKSHVKWLFLFPTHLAKQQGAAVNKFGSGRFEQGTDRVSHHGLDQRKISLNKYFSIYKSVFWKRLTWIR